jgi:hypothetical protein
MECNPANATELNRNVDFPQPHGKVVYDVDFPQPNTDGEDPNSHVAELIMTYFPEPSAGRKCRSSSPGLKQSTKLPQPHGKGDYDKDFPQPSAERKCRSSTSGLKQSTELR